MNSQPYNDEPILNPSEDLFGINSFAVALAASVLKMKRPMGSVIAINGPWGAGKSSAVNLIRHHLDDAQKCGDISIINFNCWWFRGEEALALAFFNELYAGLSPGLEDKLKSSFPKLVSQLLKAGSVVGKAAEIAGAGAYSAALGEFVEKMASTILQEEGVEKLHAKLSKVLAEQPKRFLVIIDDIDRLSPDEALLIFRIVKSVGRLPNVMYLLAYDRQLAEKIISERFPSEGPHYLEKIIQVAFELPEPMPIEVQAHLLNQIQSICGDLPEEQYRRFANAFYGNVVPEIRTPRDGIKLSNSLAVAWPAVAGEVDLGDLISLETLRLRHPDIYRSVRQNKEKLCRSLLVNGGDRQKFAKEYDEVFLSSAPTAKHERLRNVLRRLFPLLDSVWGNTHYGDAAAYRWAADRRVCSEHHFDTYFRLSVGEEILRVKDLDILLAKTSDSAFISAEVRRAAAVRTRSGNTKASVILSELEAHADKIDSQNIEPLLVGLFDAADELGCGRHFGEEDNVLRLHWLLRRLTLERFSLEKRSAIFMAACLNASLGWLANFVFSAWEDYHPSQGNGRQPAEKCLTTLNDAESLRKLLAERFLSATADGSLKNCQDLGFLLFRCSDLAEDGGVAVKEWTTSQLVSDEGIRQLAIAFTSYGSARGAGDVVATRTTHAQIADLSRLLDIQEFRRRVEEVARNSVTPEVIEFLKAWQRQEGPAR